MQEAVDGAEEQFVEGRILEHPFLATVGLVQPRLDGRCGPVHARQDLGADLEVVAGCEQPLVGGDAIVTARVPTAEGLECRQPWVIGDEGGERRAGGRSL